jgi:TetR/AcrR family acrAB operon transcriptional repressor
VIDEASRKRRPGRGAEKALATRATLVELAAELFAEQGYVQTSIRDIARRGEVTSGAIYGHFRNKADLLVAAINKRTKEELEDRTMGQGGTSDYVDVLTRSATRYKERRRLRALIVQGAAASQTDHETRESLLEEQRSHLNAWIEGYERDRDRLGIDPAVDIRTAVLYTWAVECGLGVLEGMGLEPPSAKAWSDMHNRSARSWQLPSEVYEAKPARKRR